MIHFSARLHSTFANHLIDLQSYDRWIPRGVSFQRPRHRLIAVASLGRLSRNRSIPVWFTRYPRTALSDKWRSLGITSLMNVGGYDMCTSIPTSAIMTKHASSHIVGFHEAFRSSALVIVSSPSLLSVVSRAIVSIPVWFTRYPRTANHQISGALSALRH
ncbi:hypothetical protein TNCV_2375891 [Trichonephila clavipes]|nr:hypothetical protein TNCV_2375891 [Trichonephila clavipes]